MKSTAISEGSVTVYVPARLGSQRLERKALREMNGRPLVEIILETLGQASRVSEVFLNSEAEEILRFADFPSARGTKRYKRDPRLATNETTTEEILIDFVKSVDTEFVAAVNPTNPLLTAGTIDDFFDRFSEGGYDTAFSVTPMRKHLLRNNTPVNYTPFGPHPRTQDVEEVLALNWAIAAWRTKSAQSQIRFRGDSLYVGRVGFLRIPSLEALDIDTEDDFRLCEAVQSSGLLARAKDSAVEASQKEGQL